MYRAIALKAGECGVLGNAAAVETLAGEINISFQAEGEVNRVFVDGREVTEDIRAPEVSNNASYVSGLAGVRGALLGQQRALGAEGGVVMDGRDVGTCIFPAAAVKIFLTASSAERTRRRYIELAAKGGKVDIKIVHEEMAARDAADSQRLLAPLRKAEDAVEIDSTRLSISQTAERIIEIVKAKGARQGVL
jgi:cytidylate kinase